MFEQNNKYTCYVNICNQLTPQSLFYHVKGFSSKNQEFSVSEKMHLQTFLYSNHPNDSLIMKVIHQIMVHTRIGKFTKIRNIFPYQHFILSEKLHSQIIFGMVATIIVHFRIIKIHKNSYQNIILSLRNCIHKKFFVWWPP